MEMINQSYWKGKTVLVTGHNGFKGSWLCLWLSLLGAKVHGISLENNDSNQLFKTLRLFDCIKENFLDIRDYASLSSCIQEINPKVVFHLAAQSLVRESYRDPLSTWSVNVQGSLNLLESLKSIANQCTVIMITTDKVYHNKEDYYSYHETDRLGGEDPYSASKAAAELAIHSWRSSFCGSSSHQYQHLFIATARSGNVIGGGDWAAERILPDTVKAILNNSPLDLRNPNAVRPWQHVLEPLSGYLVLAQKMQSGRDLYQSAFNFGPLPCNNCSVKFLVESIYRFWPANCLLTESSSAFHEANLLSLQITKSMSLLGWKPNWDLSESVSRTVNWYKGVSEGKDGLDIAKQDIQAYCSLM